MSQEPGQRLHSIFAQHFKHRWGGHTPSWRRLHQAERDLWAAIEEDYSPREDSRENRRR